MYWQLTNGNDIDSISGKCLPHKLNCIILFLCAWVWHMVIWSSSQDLVLAYWITQTKVHFAWESNRLYFEFEGLNQRFFFLVFFNIYDSRRRLFSPFSLVISPRFNNADSHKLYCNALTPQHDIKWITSSLGPAPAWSWVFLWHQRLL